MAMRRHSVGPTAYDMALVTKTGAPRFANPLKPSRHRTDSRGIDVDDQRCVIRGYRFSLPCLAIDLGPDNAVFKRCRHEQVIDAQAEVFTKIAGGLVPPCVSPGFRVMQTVRIVEFRARKPSESP
jgi:hypothetical protein